MCSPATQKKTLYKDIGDIKCQTHEEMKNHNLYTLYIITETEEAL